MKNLAESLTTYGYDVRMAGDVLFVGGWGIHCTLTGNVQARLVDDTHVRFTLGQVTESGDSLAYTFQRNASAL